MDIIKIGNFLAALRKEHNMTQEQLGEKIGVTNKTISRWENGNYLPPVDKLQELSRLYDISINELLAAEKLDDEGFRNAAENNLKEALGSSSFSVKEKVMFFQKKWKKDHAFSNTLEALLIIAALILGFVFDNGLQILIIFVGYIWSLYKYNQMKAYVEKNAYGTPDDKQRINEKTH